MNINRNLPDLLSWLARAAILVRLGLFQYKSKEIGGEIQSSNMADRDIQVYKAKLAEQAERYDGKCRIYSKMNVLKMDSSRRGELSDLGT